MARVKRTSDLQLGVNPRLNPKSHPSGSSATSKIHTPATLVGEDEALTVLKEVLNWSHITWSEPVHLRFEVGSTAQVLRSNAKQFIALFWVN